MRTPVGRAQVSLALRIPAFMDPFTVVVLPSLDLIAIGGLLLLVSRSMAGAASMRGFGTGGPRPRTPARSSDAPLPEPQGKATGTFDVPRAESA